METLEKLQREETKEQKFQTVTFTTCSLMGVHKKLDTPCPLYDENADMSIYNRKQLTYCFLKCSCGDNFREKIKKERKINRNDLETYLRALIDSNIKKGKVLKGFWSGYNQLRVTEQKSFIRYFCDYMELSVPSFHRLRLEGFKRNIEIEAVERIFNVFGITENIWDEKINQ